MKQQINELVFQILSNRLELKDAVELLSTSLMMSLAVLDLDMKIVHSSEIDSNVQWLELVEKSLINNDNPFDSPKMQALLNTDKCVLFPLNKKPGYSFAIRHIMANDIPEGFVAVVFDTHQSEPAFYLADSVARLYSYLCGRTNKGEKRENLIRSSVANLLLNNSSEISWLTLAMYGCGANRGYDLSPGYIVLHFYGHPGTDAYKFHSLEKVLSSKWHNSFSVSSHCELRFILCKIDIKKDAIADLLLQIRELCSKYELYCGASLPFTNLNIRADYVWQAKMAFILGRAMNSEERLFRAEKYYYYLLAASALQVFGADVLILSDIHLLLDYDKKKQTQYLETLEKYVYNLGRINPTATSLFIDRSTLNYRIQKISSLINRDLENVNVLKTLLFSISVYRINQNLYSVPEWSHKEKPLRNIHTDLMKIFSL